MSPRRAEPIWRADTILGEGPVWRSEEQRLYFVDIRQGRLLACDHEGGARQTWTIADRLASIAPAGPSRLIAALRENIVLLTLSGAERTIAPLAAPAPWRAGDRFNDGACDPAGRFWVGAMDEAEAEITGAFWRVERGQAARVLDGIKVANGPVFAADGQMYFTDSAAQTVWRARLEPDGRIVDRAVFRQFGKDEGHPDGMALDAEGGLWIARWGAGAVTRYDPSGGPQHSIITGAPHTTKCAFGGADNKRLFITSARQGLNPAEIEAAPLSGALFAVDLDVEGAPIYAFG